jgi:uroporphyrinogen-III decarboxylase
MQNPSLLESRQDLLDAAVTLEIPDRVPIVYQGEAFSPAYMGVSLADYAGKPDVAVRTTLAAMDRLAGCDALNSVPTGRIGVQLAGLWMTRFLVPGRDLPNDALWQAAEGEDMSAEEYEAVIRDGWPAFVEGFLPRVLDPADVAEDEAWFEAGFARAVEAVRAHGYVPLTGAVVATPFELLCGARSMQQFYLDLFRRPEIVARATERMLPDVVAAMLAGAQACRLPCVWVGGWRSASGMLTESVWQQFVFPQLKVVVRALVDAGYTPILHFDQDWTRALSHLLELPARRCILQLDGMTDIRAAKDLLGSHMALMGDVPPAILVTGTTTEVRTYVRDLIRDVGVRGLLVAPGCDAPFNARPENMEAMVAAALEYGS